MPTLEVVSNDDIGAFVSPIAFIIAVQISVDNRPNALIRTQQAPSVVKDPEVGIEDAVDGLLSGRIIDNQFGKVIEHIKSGAGLPSYDASIDQAKLDEGVC